ncbi:hypothetical protein Plhal703r1_c82g0173911 [Plasmopara halstedii]
MAQGCVLKIEKICCVEPVRFSLWRNSRRSIQPEALLHEFDFCRRSQYGALKSVL